LMFATKSGTAERVVSVITLIIGLLFIVTIIVLIRRDQS
jgi:hypothetical protein